MRTLTCSQSAFKSGFLPPRPRAQPVASRQWSRQSRVSVVARQYEPNVGIFGTKAGMMSFFTEDGLCLPATVIALEEGNYVTQVKTVDTDGYNAVQVGYQVVAERKITKPELGHLKKSELPALRHLREFKLKDMDAVMKYQPGQKLVPSEIFTVGSFVDIAGMTIGKGFQGTIKKYHHKRGQMTHGSKSHRQHGSIGNNTTPGRVFPGMKMAGQMGNSRHKSKALQVLKIDEDKGAIVVKGCVPGKAGNVVEVVPAKKVGVNC